jgi:hypothetical protein
MISLVRGLLILGKNYDVHSRIAAFARSLTDVQQTDPDFVLKCNRSFALSRAFISVIAQSVERYFYSIFSFLFQKPFFPYANLYIRSNRLKNK